MFSSQLKDIELLILLHFSSTFFHLAYYRIPCNLFCAKLMI